MTRLVVVSNRVTVATDKKARAGGLAVALQDALQQYGGVWFGWSGKIGAKPPAEPTVAQVGEVTYATVDLTRKQFNEYYNGFANRALWPLFHYRLDLTAFSQQTYASYLDVNRQFCDHLVKLVQPEDMIWVHDYHLIPLGEELRRQGVDRPMGFFLHTPFPAMEILTALPSHRALMQALCAYDLVGFHTENDLRAFLDYIVHEAGGGIMGDHLVHAFGRTLRVEIFPIGIDTDDFIKAGARAARSARAQFARGRQEGHSWIIGVDRLDYSKGIVQRLRSFERFLERHPAHKNKVTLVQIAPPSRSEVPEYKDIQRELETEAGHLNGRFAEFDWVPVNYLNRSFNRNELAGFYRYSRVGLITPFRDGMNLVAKEYVAAQNPEDPGVLVLSRFAGAARELDAAVIVNPYDLDDVGDAIAQGLAMPVEERKERWSSMMEVLKTNTLTAWRDSFLEALSMAPYE